MLCGINTIPHTIPRTILSTEYPHIQIESGILRGILSVPQNKHYYGFE